MFRALQKNRALRFRGWGVEFVDSNLFCWDSLLVGGFCFLMGAGFGHEG